MAIVYTGPFSGADIPGGQQINGWSNQMTGAGTMRNRYRDGDPQSSFAWVETAGNLNYKLATSRRLLCSCRFNGSAADPTKSNTGNDFTSRDAIYTILGPFELVPNALRGIDQPPKLSIRVRARRTGGATSHKVRVYTVGSEQDAGIGWPITAARATGYAEFSIASGTYPATPGFSSAVEQTIALDPAGTYCSWDRWDHPAVSTIDAQQVDVLVTYLVLAAIGDGAGNGTYVAALEVWEEAPAA